MSEDEICYNQFNMQSERNRVNITQKITS